MNHKTFIILFIAVLLSTIFVDSVMGKPRAQMKRELSKKECKMIMKLNNIRTKQIYL